MKKKMADIVLKNAQPPDYKAVLSSDDLAEIIVQRLGLQRKKSMSNHARLLKFLLKLKRDETPTDIQTIAGQLQVSVSQAYEEMRKWRTLNILEFVRVPVQGTKEMMKGYLLGGATVNQLIDRVQASLNAFIRGTKRIAKDFDDQISAEIARDSRRPSSSSILPAPSEKGVKNEGSEPEKGMEKTAG